MTEPIRIVDRPSTRLFYQGYTHGTDDEIAAQFFAKFGERPTEIVRYPAAGSIVLAGPVLKKHIEEMRKSHPRQAEVDQQSAELLREGHDGAG